MLVRIRPGPRGHRGLCLPPSIPGLSWALAPLSKMRRQRPEARHGPSQPPVIRAGTPRGYREHSWPYGRLWGSLEPLSWGAGHCAGPKDQASPVVCGQRAETQRQGERWRETCLISCQWRPPNELPMLSVHHGKLATDEKLLSKGQIASPLTALAFR